MTETYLIRGSSKDFVANEAHELVEIKELIGKDISTNIRTLTVKVLPHGQIKPHTHETLEVFYIVQGCGEALINGEYHVAKQGDVIYAPAGQVHGLKNNSNSDLILIANFPKFTE